MFCNTCWRKCFKILLTTVSLAQKEMTNKKIYNVHQCFETMELLKAINNSSECSCHGKNLSSKCNKPVHVASKPPAGSILLLPIKLLNCDLNFMESTALYTLAGNACQILKPVTSPANISKAWYMPTRGYTHFNEDIFYFVARNRLQCNIFLLGKITVQGIQFKSKLLQAWSLNLFKINTSWVQKASHF